MGVCWGVATTHGIDMSSSSNIPIAESDRVPEGVGPPQVPPDEAADFGRARHRARRVAPSDAAAVAVPSDKAADRSRSCHRPRRVAPSDEAAVRVVPDEAANISRSRHRARRVARRDTTVLAPPDEATDRTQTRHRAAFEAKIADAGRVSSYNSEQTDIILRGTVDEQIADDVALSVKRTGESIAAIPDGRETRVAVPVAGRARVNIRRELQTFIPCGPRLRQPI